MRHKKENAPHNGAQKGQEEEEASKRKGRLSEVNDTCLLKQMKQTKHDQPTASDGSFKTRKPTLFHHQQQAPPQLLCCRLVNGRGHPLHRNTWGHPLNPSVPVHPKSLPPDKAIPKGEQRQTRPRTRSDDTCPLACAPSSSCIVLGMTPPTAFPENPATLLRWRLQLHSSHTQFRPYPRLPPPAQWNAHSYTTAQRTRNVTQHHRCRAGNKCTHAQHCCRMSCSTKYNRKTTVHNTTAWYPAAMQGIAWRPPACRESRGGGAGAQQFVYEKWVKSMFAFLIFFFSPSPPMVVSCSNTSLQGSHGAGQCAEEQHNAHSMHSWVCY